MSLCVRLLASFHTSLVAHHCWLLFLPSVASSAAESPPVSRRFRPGYVLAWTLLASSESVYVV